MTQLPTRPPSYAAPVHTPPHPVSRRFFFFNDTAPTEIYTLSLHDALPISIAAVVPQQQRRPVIGGDRHIEIDRKSTRLNSSHLGISYAVFCLKKKQL